MIHPGGYRHDQTFAIGPILPLVKQIKTARGSGRSTNVEASAVGARQCCPCLPQEVVQTREISGLIETRLTLTSKRCHACTMDPFLGLCSVLPSGTWHARTLTLAKTKKRRSKPALPIWPYCQHPAIANSLSTDAATQETHSHTGERSIFATRGRLDSGDVRVDWNSPGFEILRHHRGRSEEPTRIRIVLKPKRCAYLTARI